jgi:rhodanese-related sulfurtransferase
VKEVFGGAIKEAVVILVAGVIVSLAVNYVRDDGIPLIAEAEAFRVSTDAEFLKPEDARDLFEQGTALFVDAREPEIFMIEHIEGAMNVPSSMAQVDSIAWLVGADPLIVTYASEASQRQAGVVADKLLEAGFSKVHVLYGGIEGWKDLDLPTEGAKR